MENNKVIKLFKENVLLITGLTISFISLGVCASFLQNYGIIKSIISLIFAIIVFFAFMDLAKKTK